MFFDSVNTFSTTFHEYENRAALFAKPATPIQPKGSFLREHEYQRNPFALPGFSFETREPPPLGLPSDRLANIIKERKKTPAEIREIVQTIVNGPQPDTSSPFQYFLWAMSMEMKKPVNNYPADIILKLISDLVIAQPQILEKIPTPSQIRNREVYLENIPPFLLDVQGNLTTKLPPLDEYKLQFEGKDMKQALIASAYSDKPVTDVKGNRVRVKVDDEDEEEYDVFTFDPPGDKTLPPTFSFIFLNYQVIDPSFLSLTNFDTLPESEGVIMDLIEYVFVPSRRSSPEQMNKPPYRAVNTTNEDFLGNLLLGMDEEEQWISVYLSPLRPLKARTRFCKAFFLEAISYFIHQSSKPQFTESYRIFYERLSGLDFELPFSQLIPRLQEMYSDFYHSLRMPKLEEVGGVVKQERKHSAILPSADPVSLVDAFRELKVVMTSLASVPNEDAKAAETREEKKALEAERFFKWLQGLNYKGLTDQWAISSFTSNWTKDLKELAETKNVDVLRTFLLTAVGSEGKQDPRSMNPSQLEGLFVNIRDHPESPAWTAVFSVLKNFNSFTDLKKWFGRDLGGPQKPAGFPADQKHVHQRPSQQSKASEDLDFSKKIPEKEIDAAFNVPQNAPTIIKTIVQMVKNRNKGVDIYDGIRNITDTISTGKGKTYQVYVEFLGYVFEDEGNYHENKQAYIDVMTDIAKGVSTSYGSKQLQILLDAVRKTTGDLKLGIDKPRYGRSITLQITPHGLVEYPGFPRKPYIDELLKDLEEAVIEFMEKDPDPYKSLGSIIGSGMKKKRALVGEEGGRGRKKARTG
jgi:hypothetical protein